MGQGCMTVGMAVRLRALPALVGMLMMFVVDMQVLVVQGAVVVLQLGGVSPRPEQKRRRRGGEGQDGQGSEGR